MLEGGSFSSIRTSNQTQNKMGDAISSSNAAIEARAAALLRDAATRWLVKEELAFLLQNHARLGVPIRRQLQLQPPSTSLSFCDCLSLGVASCERDAMRNAKVRGKRPTS